VAKKMVSIGTTISSTANEGLKLLKEVDRVLSEQTYRLGGVIASIDEIKFREEVFYTLRRRKEGPAGTLDYSCQLIDTPRWASNEAPILSGRPPIDESIPENGEIESLREEGRDVLDDLVRGGERLLTLRDKIGLFIEARESDSTLGGLRIFQAYFSAMVDRANPSIEVISVLCSSMTKRLQGIQVDPLREVNPSFKINMDTLSGFQEALCLTKANLQQVARPLSSQ
jgi:hypothetical protein